MADDIADKRRRSKKKRSSLLTWKKKFNIKKRFTNKLPLHRRHIRTLMSGWSVTDVRSVLTQYEITAMLKQLAFMADKSRPSTPTLASDLGEMFTKSSCCDIIISSCELTEEECALTHLPESHSEVKGHKSLLQARWPTFNKIIKSQISSQNRRSYQESSYSSNANTSNSATPSHIPELPKICVYGITFDKLLDIFKEVYEGTKFGNTQSHPRKLLPLPTTDDSLHIRNTRGKQPYRHTILECEQPVVPRRNVVRRKQKQRFSMDERMLSNQASSSAASTRAQQAKTGKVTPGGIIQPSSSSQCLKDFSLISNEDRNTSTKHKEVPNPLQEDMLKMFQDSGDVKIVFSLDSINSFSSWITPHARRRDISSHYQAWISHYESFYPMSLREWQDPLFCHRVILAARSPYFRRLLEKQMSSPSWFETSSDVATLEIDGNIISPRYMSAVLYTMYTDKVDLHRLYDRGGQRGMSMGTAPPTSSTTAAAGQFYMRDAIMLHHIGYFIEFPSLVHGCEEFIVDNLDQNNILQVLQWTLLPHGSDWVKRQVNSFIRERFTELLSTGVLFELDSSQVVEVLQSDFVNASELDVLKCALRWGEHELLRRIEKREPNLLTHTAHSVSRSKTGSARRRDLIASRIEELHECTASVLACVRMQHILPANHELFTNAVKRGVISRPPADLLENLNDKEGSGRQWMKSGVDFVPPRLFQPYVDETRNILDERFAQDSDCVSLRSVHNLSRDQTWCSVRHQMELGSHVIPDALYMVGQARLPSRRRYGNRDLQLHFPSRNEILIPRPAKPVKYIGEHYPVPDVPTLRELFAREREFRATYIVNKVLRACIDCCHSNSRIFGGRGRVDAMNTEHTDQDETEYCNRCFAVRLVRLFVVRERGLPDCAVNILQRPQLYYDIDELRTATSNDGSRSNPIRTERLPRTMARLDSLYPARQSQDHVPLGAEGETTSRDSPQKHQKVIYFDRVDTKTHNQNIKHLNPPGGMNSNILNLHQTNVPPVSDSTSTSSSEEEIPQVRRKRKSLSRKGSTSTTSHQSIPDVAASANSSLQRLRISASQEAAKSSPLLNTPAQLSDDLAKSTEFDSTTSSSCEENTSENEEEQGIASNFSDVLITKFSSRQNDLHDFTSSARQGVSDNVASNQKHDAPKRISKVRPPKRPLSAGMTEIFNSNLNFIDGELESSDDNLSDVLCSRISGVQRAIPSQGSLTHGQRSSPNLGPLSQNQRSTPSQGSLTQVQRSTPHLGSLSQGQRSKVLITPVHYAFKSVNQSDMPELVKDGTLPRGYEAQPDIYPSQGDLDCAVTEQCGQYFFCSLTRDRMSKNKGEKTTSRTSFTFAINEGRGESSQSNKNNRGSEMKQKKEEKTVFL